MRVIIVNRVRLGEICRQAMETGKIPTNAFVVGAVRGVWERLLEQLIDHPKVELLMIDASHIKVHPHGSGARGGSQDMAKTKGGSTPSTFGRGCAWYAGPNHCYKRHLSGW